MVGRSESERHWSGMAMQATSAIVEVRENSRELWWQQNFLPLVNEAFQYQASIERYMK
jgi:hypothetical protein